MRLCERDKQIETDRQTDRQIGGQRERQTDTEREREREREREHAGTQSDRGTNRLSIKTIKSPTYYNGRYAMPKKKKKKKQCRPDYCFTHWRVASFAYEINCLVLFSNHKQ